MRSRRFTGAIIRCVYSRGLENPEYIAGWMRQSLERFHALGETLQAGGLQQITGIGLQRNVAVAQKGGANLCVGWKNTLTPRKCATA